MQSLSNEDANSIIAQVVPKKKAQFSEICKIVENYLKLVNPTGKYGKKGESEEVDADEKKRPRQNEGAGALWNQIRNQISMLPASDRWSLV